MQIFFPFGFNQPFNFSFFHLLPSNVVVFIDSRRRHLRPCDIFQSAVEKNLVGKTNKRAEKKSISQERWKHKRDDTWLRAEMKRRHFRRRVFAHRRVDALPEPSTLRLLNAPKFFYQIFYDWLMRQNVLIQPTTLPPPQLFRCSSNHGSSGSLS